MVESQERAIIGAMLGGEMALKDGSSMLVEQHFGLESHRRIFKTIVTLHSKSAPVDSTSVANYLKKSRELDSIGGLGYLMELADGVPRNFDITYYAQQIREASALRRLALAGTQLASAATEGDESSAVLIERLNRSVDDLVEENSHDEMVTMEQLVPRVIQRILHPEKRQRPIPTGLIGIDNKTLGGIRPKELWICGGLPGRSKTSLGRQIGRNAARNGTPVAIFSIEMANEEWSELDIAAEAGVPPWKMRLDIPLGGEEGRRMIEAAERMLSWPMRYEDSGKMHIRSLQAKARLSVMKFGTKLVIVDYLQRVKSDEKEIRLRLGTVAEALAEFAKDNDCAVLALSQLARRGDVNLKPTMQDLKESGDLEAHAHTILLNYRPIDRDSGNEGTERFTGNDEIIIAKQRFGPIGSVPVAYNPDSLSFEMRGL